MKKKRVLWLINHSTLREFEVPLLIELGYEVFCPKSFPYDEGNLSASIDYKYDESLTIAKETLDKLNNVNFYEDISVEISSIINEFFGIAFFAAFPRQFKMLTKHFKGVLCLRPFGLPNGYTYAELFAEANGFYFLAQIEKLKGRFFFCQAFSDLAEIESNCFKNHAIYLPLGLKNTSISDNWNGKDKKVFFVCPRIKTSEYFNNIYKFFKLNFKEFDYVIGGAQPISVREDKNVLGFISREEYDNNMKALSVMFYHSKEERHIHYHPFEAIRNGMPLIFMGGGVLDKFGGKDLPGRCTSVKEAKRKIKRILKGDEKFIKLVRNTQEILIKPMNYQVCKTEWVRNFIQIEKACKKQSLESKKKVAVIMSGGYTGGVLDFSIRFALSIKRAIEDEKAEVELIFAHEDLPIFNCNHYFQKIKDAGIPIRTFNKENKDKEWVKKTLKLMNYPDNFNDDFVTVCNDGINYFFDCDYLLLTSDAFEQTFFSLRPYALVVHDYIQRYVPEIFPFRSNKNVMDCAKNADTVFVTSKSTMMDAVQYGGINKNKIRLIPLMIEAMQNVNNSVESEDEYKDDFFVWSTNVSPHKNHQNAMMALVEYYKNGGALKGYVTGSNTEYLDDSSNIEDGNGVPVMYIKKLQKIIKENRCLKENLVFCGNLSKSEYAKLIQTAKFLFHPGYGDNGNGSAVDAASLGTPTISSDYPAMRYMDEFAELNMTFFDPFNIESISSELKKAEKFYKEYAKKLPSFEQLKKHTTDNTYKWLYHIVKETIGF